MPDDTLVKPVKMASFVKKVGIQGIRAQAKAALSEVKPETCPNRYAIGFDDSGSMGLTEISDAKKAVAGFLAACSPVETSVAIYPFNMTPKPLTIFYDIINAFVSGIKATGGTPLHEIMGKMMDNVPKITRGILFSDGSPTDDEGDVIHKAQEAKIPFDTVYIGYGDSPILRSIAERTGGNYLKFDNTTSFAKNMKYLSPKYVALLSNADLKAKIQRGETI